MNVCVFICIYIHACTIIFLFTHIDKYLWIYENLNSNCSLKVSKYIGNSPVFVAGGTRGIGLEVVKQLSSLGTPVHCLARNPVFMYFSIYLCMHIEGWTYLYVLHQATIAVKHTCPHSSSQSGIYLYIHMHLYLSIIVCREIDTFLYTVFWIYMRCLMYTEICD